MVINAAYRRSIIMPIIVNWLQEPSIRLVRYEGVITTEEFEVMLAQETALYECSPNKLYIILDAHKMTEMAVNPLRVVGFMKIVKHPKLASFIMIGSNPASNFWAENVSRIMRFAPVHTS